MSDCSLNGVRDSRSDRYTEEFLYDLFRDPDENKNLIADPDYEEVRSCMRSSMIRNIEQFEHYTPEIYAYEREREEER